MSDTVGIESKWLKKWESARVFDSDPDTKKPKYFLTVPYPYASGALHVGHARSYTLGDVTARYRRMQGYNVLFPMASHITGTPILAISKKIEQKDEKAIAGNKNYVSFYEQDAKKIDEIVSGFTDPNNVARFYATAIKQDFERMGYAIDWRRFFTTGDKHYNAFIRWQYQKLKEKNYILKGKHAVYYCPNCGNPVTTDDIKSGDEYEIGMSEFYLIKMKFKDGYLVAATLRPETIFGVVNTWIHPDETYVKAEVDGETWYVAEKFAQKYADQQHNVKVVEKIPGSEFIGKKLTVPIVGRQVPILEATFVDVDIVTGVVNSVPAHAPYDYIAGIEAMERLKIDITPIPLITTDGYSKLPAKDLVEKAGIKSQNDTEKLEKVTAELYKDEFYRGVMNENCGEFEGMRVSQAKDAVIEKLKETNQIGMAYEKNIKDPSGMPVKDPRCRCDTPITINVLADQWFLNYGDQGWKELAKELLLKMAIEPEMYRKGFEHAIDWLHQWPCTRNRGLGTKLPFDERWMIESLSDSTIYMAYYTISRHITENKLKEEQLTPELFDYIFLGVGDAKKISDKTKIDPKIVKAMRDEFTYWYPMDERRTGTAHISNHLTFMMFHHSAIFPSQYWPKKISLNEMLIAEGKKMSKSLGNVIPLHNSIGKYGADVVRLYLIYAADAESTLDWRESQVESTKKRLTQFIKIIEDTTSMEGRTDKNHLDDWILSRLNTRISEATESLNGFQTRKALQVIFYEMFKDINWYLRRAQPNTQVMKDVANKWIRLMTPFTPFICEELWEKLGGDGFISNAPYPKAEESKTNEDAESSEEYVKNLMDDIINIQQIMKSPSKTISLYISDDWKYKAFQALKEGKTVKDVMADPEIKKHGKDAVKIMQMRKDELPKKILGAEKEKHILSAAAGFLSQEFNCQIIVDPPEDPENKRRFAQPNKPGIYLT